MTQVLRYGERMKGSHRGITLDGPWPEVEVVHYSASSAPQRLYTEPRPPKRERYSSGNNMLGPDSIRQIVEALESLDWVQEIKQFLRSRHGNNSSFPHPEPPEPPEGPREHYVRSRKTVEQFHREARQLRRDDPDSQERYSKIGDEDAKYRANREVVASRIKDYALRNNCSWDEAVAKTGEQLPLPLMPAGVS